MAQGKKYKEYIIAVQIHYAYGILKSKGFVVLG
jgi:hypothetical protein